MIIPLDTLEHVAEMKFTLVKVRTEFFTQFRWILVFWLRSLAKLK